MGDRGAALPRRSTGLALVGIVALGVGLPLALAFLTGAVHVPRNDDWELSRMAFHLRETGEVVLLGWGVSSIVGHLAWALPWLWLFGSSQQTLHLAQAAAAAAGLGCAYLVARSFLTEGRALLATVLVAAMPSFALLSTSYMTDTTAFAGQMGCLALGLKALQQQRRPGVRWALLLTGAVLLGGFAFTVREAGAAALAAVLTAHLLQAWQDRRRGQLIVLLGVAIAMGAAFLAFFLWRRGLPGTRQLPLDFNVDLSVGVEAYFTLAFACSPAIALAAWTTGWRVQRPQVLIASALLVLYAGIVVLVQQAETQAGLLLGNGLTRFGSLGQTVLLGRRPELFGPLAWSGVTVVALVAGAVLAPVALRAVLHVTGRPSRPLTWKPAWVCLCVFGALSALIMLSYAAVGYRLFDRYTWATAVVLLLLVLRVPACRPGPTGAVAAGVVLLSTVSLLVTVEEYTYDAARWQAGEAAVASGIPATATDAGFEWVGYHYREPAFTPADENHWDVPRRWYNGVFPAASNCALVAATPLEEPHLQLIERRPYRALLVAGERSLWLYRNPPACDAN